MNFDRVFAIIKKEFIQISRDPRSLWMAAAIPMILLTLFGYALTFDVDNVPLAVWDQSNTAASRDYILNFKNSPYFNIVAYCGNYRELDDKINRSKVLAALVIPRDFSQALNAKKKATVQLIVDAADSNTASIILGYTDSLTAAYNRKLLIKQGGIFIDSIEMRPRIWFNETLKSKNYIIPGLIAVIMMILAALLPTFTISREWERGTMEQLISTPIKNHELILGKFTPYFVIGLADVIIAVLTGEFIFHVPFRGDLILLLTLSCLFLADTMFWGILISVVTKNQFVATYVAFITTFIPAFLLSGFAFPISNMPLFLRVITYLVPARYFVTILKGIYLKGIGLNILWPEVLFLSVFSLITAALTVIMFKKTVD